MSELLFETIPLYRERLTQPSIPRRLWSAASSVSPDRSRLAFIDGVNHDVLYIVNMRQWQEQGEPQPLCQFSSASLPSRNAKSTHASIGCERLSAPCWTLDSSSVVVVGQETGSVFLADHMGRLLFAHLPETRFGMPWVGDVAAIAVVSPDRALIATHSQTNIYLIPIPLPLPAGVISGPPPPSLKVKSITPIVSLRSICRECRTILAMSFESSSNLLAIAGEGIRGDRHSAVLSLWSYLVAKDSTEVMLKNHLLFPLPAASPHLIHDGQQWGLSFTILSEVEGKRATISFCSPRTPGLITASMSQGLIMKDDASPDDVRVRNGTSCDRWNESSILVGLSDGSVSIISAETYEVQSSSSFSKGVRAWSMNHSDSQGNIVPCALVLDPSVSGWQLSVLIQRTPREMMLALAQKGKWDESFEISERHMLDRDEVFRLRWKSERVNELSFSSNLCQIADKAWVVEECATCVAADAHVQATLVNHGLDLTSTCYSSCIDDPNTTESHIGWWRRMRLLLLRHKDRLDTYLLLSEPPSWNGESFALFRDADMVSVAQELAACADMLKASILIQRHSSSLSPFLLEVLDKVPESLDPRLYSQMLPKADGSCSLTAESMLREADWVESKTTADQLLQDGFFDSLASATEHMHRVCLEAGYSNHLKALPSPSEVTNWYHQRACEIDSSSGQLHNSILLLEAGVQRGVTRNNQLLSQARSLSKLVGSMEHLSSIDAWETSLDQFQRMEPQQQLLLVLSYGDASEWSLAEDEESAEEEYDEEWIGRIVSDKETELRAEALSTAIKEHGSSYLSCIYSFGGDSLLGLLQSQMESRPLWFQALVWVEARRLSAVKHQGLFATAVDLSMAVTACIRASRVEDTTECLLKSLACCAWSLIQSSCPHDLLARDVEPLIKLLHAGKVMRRRGIPVEYLSPRALSYGTRESSVEILAALLAGSRSELWKEREWRLLWADIDHLCSHGALPGISPQQAFSDMLKSVLDRGQMPLAASLISASLVDSGSLMGGALVRPPRLDESNLVWIVSETASRMLSSASSLDDQETSSAVGLLALVPEAALTLTSSSLPPVLRLLMALPKIKKLLSSLPSLHSLDRSPSSLVDDIDKGGPQLLIQRILGSFSSIPDARLHRQVEALVDIALVIGSEGSSPEEIRSSIILLAAASAISAGDMKAGLSLTLRLAALRYSPAAVLAATLGMEQLEKGSDQETRFRLLSFAASHCDTDALPHLLKELAAAGKRRLASQSLMSDFPKDKTSPSDLLAHSLASVLESLPLSMSGCNPLTVAVILQARRAEEAVALVQSHLKANLAHDELQRTAYSGVYAHSLRAIICLLPLMTNAERRLLCHMSHLDLLRHAKEIDAAPGLTPSLPQEASVSLLASDALLAHLKGVEDGRSVSQLNLGPSIQPEAASAFILGDKTSMRAVVLQQAMAAGQTALKELGGSNWEASVYTCALSAAAAMKLLDDACALGCSYNAAAEEECRVQFVKGVMTLQDSSGALPAQMRSLVLREVELLLPRASPQTATLLAHSMAISVWSGIPPTSYHHISTILITLSKCVVVLSTPQNELSLQLDSIISLVDKAFGSGSLKGLDARSLLTPILRPCTNAFLLPLIKAEMAFQGGEVLSSDGTLGLISIIEDTNDQSQSLLVQAQAAFFDFVSSPSTAASASKLLKALQTLLPPSRALSALPPSLPYLCLLLKLTTTHDQKSNLLDSSAWSLAAPCLDKLTVPQLRSWADFFLLSSGKQPLPSKATRGKRHPMLASEPLISLAALEACIPKLVSEQPSAAVSECLSLLRAQYQMLRVWHALDAQAKRQGVALSKQLEAASNLHAGSTDMSKEVMTDVVIVMAEGGCPMTAIWSLVEAASKQGPILHPSHPQTSLDGFLGPTINGSIDVTRYISKVISEAVKTRLAHLFVSSANASEILAALELIASSLSSTPLTASVEPLLKSLRNDLWYELRSTVNGLDVSMYTDQWSAGSVSRLLDLQSLLPGIWPGWKPPLDSGLESCSDDRAALVFGRTLISLGGVSLWPHLSLTSSDVSSREAAGVLFKRLVASPLTLAMVEHLERLLAETWAEGKVWGGSPTEMDGNGEDDSCSTLHDCWRDLCLAAMTSGLPHIVIKIVDKARHRASNDVSPLSTNDLSILIKASEDRPMLSLCLLLLSLHLPEFQRPSLSSDLGRLELNTCQGSTEMEVLCLLCAVLLPFSHNQPQGKSVPLLWLTQSDLWSSIVAKMADLPVRPSWDAEDPLGCLFPALASALIINGQAAHASQLTSTILRLHPSLASLSGGVDLLCSSLKDTLSRSSAQGMHLRSERNESADENHRLLSMVPHTLASLRAGLDHVCNKALEMLQAKDF